MPTAQGHNLTVTRKELEPFMKKIEALVEDRKAVQDDIKEVKAEVKAKGYDIKTFNDMLKLRAMDSTKRQEQEDLRYQYMSALGLC